jgi:hypothetical protein
VALIPLLALYGLFGQRPSTSVAENDAATLKVYSPSHVRGGLLFTTRFEVDAKRALRRPRLVLDPGWIEGMQVNSITPDAVAQQSDNGRIVLELGSIPAREKVVTFVQFQVNPTNIGRRSQNVSLEEAGWPPLDIRRTVTIFP